MTASIEQLLEQLYGEIEEAKPMPLSNDKCVIERDRILDMIDDVKAEMPAEIKTTISPPPSGRPTPCARRRRTMPASW